MYRRLQALVTLRATRRAEGERETFLLSCAQFSQKKADGEVRWAVLNAVALLRQHTAAHTALAAAMQRGESVGSCIQTLEGMLNKDELKPAD